MKYAQTTNNKQLTIVKAKAFFSEIIPFGISRMAVRGFLASNVLSRKRLKAMAAERAKIMQKITKPNFIKKYLMYKTSLVSASIPENSFLIFISKSPVLIPKKNPINAKGIAKMV